MQLIIPHEDFKLISNGKIFKSISLKQKKPSIFFVDFVELKVFTSLDLIRIVSINYNSAESRPKISQIIKFDGGNFEKNLDLITSISPFMKLSISSLLNTQQLEAKDFFF